MKLGKKIYFEKSTGLIIWNKGEMEGDLIETTLEEDKETLPLLTMIPDNQLGVKQLEYGELQEEFKTCKAYKINPDTEEVEFLF